MSQNRWILRQRSVIISFIKKATAMNEDNVIDGTINYLKDKNRHRDSFKVLKRCYARDGDHGIDIKCAAYSNSKISNRYYIEAKGTLKAKDNSEKKSKFETEFRWAFSQLILDMNELSTATVYGIAVPETEKDNCLKLMRNNKGLKRLKIRLYLAYKDDNGEYYAKELKPKDIYT